jgi:hypothetical protein
MADPAAPATPSRRDVLVAALVVAAAAGAGVSGAFAGALRPMSGHPLPPPELIAAATEEQALLAALDGTAGAGLEPAVVQSLRADHRAHLAAISAVLDQLGHTAPLPAATAPSGGLAAAETAAARRGASRAAALAGAPAVLLATIAACEASHAAVLT